MGDFVDRGFYSVETFLLLLALKVPVVFSFCLVKNSMYQILEVFNIQVINSVGRGGEGEIGKPNK
jgi:predicted LPLAT superfamily acyltransferase